MQYPANTRTIRVLCTGQVDSTYLLKALRNGADGVLVIGCKFGECHYISGNYHASEKVNIIKSILAKVGLSDKRVDMKFVSSAEGNKYIQSVKEFIDSIKSIGPSPINSKEKADDMKRILDAFIMVVSDYRIRSMLAKKKKLQEEGNVYKEKVTEERFTEIIDGMVESEIVRKSILTCLKEKSYSCADIAEKISEPPELVLSHLVNLRKKNLIDVDKVKERSPYYKIL
jgi:F420-non-reducing hydrogenase iron-sulfur subunit